MTVKITEVEGNLYRQYPMQCQAQPVYIEVNLAACTMTADYNAEIGNGVPAEVWNKHTIWFYLPSPCIAGHGINKIMAEITPKVAELLDSYRSVYNGNNYVGVYDEDLASEIERRVEDLAANTAHPIHVMDAGDWFEGSTVEFVEDIRSGKRTLDDIRVVVESEDETPNYDELILTGKDAYIEELTELVQNDS